MQRHTNTNRTNRHIRHLSVLMIAAAFVVLVMPSASSNLRAQSPTSLTSCQTITASGSYILGNDITAPTNQICFSIRASNVTFNGNGKTITANGAEALEVADYGSGPYSNVSVSNLTSNEGIRILGETNDAITIDHNAVGAIVDYGSDDVHITYNTVGEGGINVNNKDTTWTPLRPVIDHNTITGGSVDTKILLEVAGGGAHPCPRVDAVVTNNTVTDTRSDPPPEATAAVRIRCATHTTFTNNVIRSTATTIGLYMRDESDYGDYENNSFWTHDQEVVRIASGNVDKTYPSHNVFKNNTFRSDNGPTMYFQAMGSDNLFQNNVFWGPTGGWPIITGTNGNVYDHNTYYITGTGYVSVISYRDGPPSDSWTNNIFDYSGSSVWGYDGWGNLRYTGDNNLYFNRAGTVAFGGMGASLAAWRTNTGQDASSREGDPLFVDTANGDFHVQAGSPAIGHGINGSDIGALPFTTPACTENWSYGAWSTCSNHSQSRTATDANACGTTGYRQPLTRTCDTTAPTVAVTAPSSGGSVSGANVIVTASASDDLIVKGVQFQLDGNDLGGEDVYSPYAATWDTTGVADGTHVLSAVARDASGNATTSAAVTVTTNNGISCIENWSCGSWSACSSGTQSRTCTDANSCGTTANRPPLSQSCTVGPQCGATCTGCTNHILATACTMSQKQCDGTNTVDDITLSNTSITAGQQLTVSINYSCYASDDNLALWYYNGSSWRMIQAWGQGTLTGCNTSVGTDGTRSATFTPDSVAGTQYVRAIEAAGATPLASTSSCPNLAWGDADDMAFTVTGGSCTENWSCGSWSTCSSGTQTRTCTDANVCGTTANQPPLSQSCTVPTDSTAPSAILDLTAH